MSKLWLKYENWLKLGKQNRVYRYTPKVYRYTLASGGVYRYTTVHVPVPVHYCSCTGTLSENCPDFVIFPTFDANSLHTTSIIHNTSKTNLEFM